MQVVSIVRARSPFFHQFSLHRFLQLSGCFRKRLNAVVVAHAPLLRHPWLHHVTHDVSSSSAVQRTPVSEGMPNPTARSSGSPLSMTSRRRPGWIELLPQSPSRGSRHYYLVPSLARVDHHTSTLIGYWDQPRGLRSGSIVPCIESSGRISSLLPTGVVLTGGELPLSGHVGVCTGATGGLRGISNVGTSSRSTWTAAALSCEARLQPRRVCYYASPGASQRPVGRFVIV